MQPVSVEADNCSDVVLSLDDGWELGEGTRGMPCPVGYACRTSVDCARALSGSYAGTVLGAALNVPGASREAYLSAPGSQGPVV